MSAAEGVQEMPLGGVVLLVGRLDAALRHHGVGVADAQLGGDHHVCAALVSLNGRGSARAAAANDQHVHVVVNLV